MYFRTVLTCISTSDPYVKEEEDSVLHCMCTRR